uniref:Uncharacterized protein n=1 Tax=Arundo donax TaxID=35708 RepID=A0A0A9CFP1_ARUDO
MMLLYIRFICTTKVYNWRSYGFNH